MMLVCSGLAARLMLVCWGLAALLVCCGYPCRGVLHTPYRAPPSVANTRPRVCSFIPCGMFGGHIQYAPGFRPGLWSGGPTGRSGRSSIRARGPVGLLRRIHVPGYDHSSLAGCLGGVFCFAPGYGPAALQAAPGPSHSGLAARLRCWGLRPVGLLGRVPGQIRRRPQTPAPTEPPPSPSAVRP